MTTGDDQFPDRNMEHHDKVAWMIETHGWALEPVAERRDVDPPVPPYAYTIGIESTYGFPEIVVFGLTPVAVRGLVGLVVDLLAERVQPPVGALFTGLLENDLRAALLPIDVDEWLDLFQAASTWHRGSSFRVVQLVWPDRTGRMPWEAGYDGRLRLAQPVIGVLDGIE